MKYSIAAYLCLYKANTFIKNNFFKKFLKINMIFIDKKRGDAGDRTRGLKHAKLALYH